MSFHKLNSLAVLILSLLCIGLATSAHAGKSVYGNVDVARVRSVYDGDTFRCDIEGWPPIAGRDIGVRIAGIDTPEKRGTKGRVKALALAARALTARELRQARRVELRNIRRGKYFRLVADVLVDGRSLARILMKQGLAKAYDGGKKPAW